MRIDNNARYWAYSNYLIALSLLIKKEHICPKNFAFSIANLSGFKKMPHNLGDNTGEIGKLLRMSWLTELLINKISEMNTLLPYATPWSMIQCYYAVYLSIRAYLQATGRAVRENHKATLRTISSDITSYIGRFPSPWRCVLNGDPKSSSISLMNTSCANPELLRLRNALESPHTGNPCQHYCLFLKTTRERQIKEYAVKWKAKHQRSRFPKEKRQDYASSQLSATTIFDALYRNRIRSNYHDIDSFIYSEVRPVDFDKLHSAIRELTFFTLLLFEMLIAKSIGKKKFNSIVTGFIKSPVGAIGTPTISERCELIVSVL